MATNILGEKRRTMCSNVLHQRAILAKSNTHCLSLPPSTFTYGIKSIKKEGVPDALCWIRDGNNEQSGVEGEMVDDFIALNCESVKAGVTTCREITHFRATHEILRPSIIIRRSKSDVPEIDPDMVHGIANREPTPMPELLAHKYQAEWIQEQLAKETEQNQLFKKRKAGSRGFSVGETKTSLLRSCHKPQKKESFWKLRQFSEKATGGLDTFRSERSHKLAFEAHRTDKISRLGKLGQGIFRTGECA
ncbi:unnamed protein product [Calicophoron daubneyi]|uniref:Uncharacterized protein n=1 Tax=Calicophoron daubneyi TaxID=300641 RepID=A0AAV2TRZ6_CALDB